MFRKILAFYTKYFAIWVVLCGVLAYFWPEPLVKLGSYKFTDHLNVNKLFFSVTMFGIGAVLQIKDFRRIAQRPIIWDFPYTIIYLSSATPLSLVSNRISNSSRKVKVSSFILKLFQPHRQQKHEFSN